MIPLSGVISSASCGCLQVEQLSARVAPGTALPEVVRQYAPPAVQRKTSYDALKEAGHAAAGHIEMWRRCGRRMQNP